MWKTGCFLDNGKSSFHTYRILKTQREVSKKRWGPWHISDSAVVTLPFTLWPVVNCPDCYISTFWSTGSWWGPEANVSLRKRLRMAVPDPEDAAIPWAWEDRWRPAVTDGYLLKSRFKWGCITCWQGGEYYPNLKHMCASVFLIHIYHIFSVPPHSYSLPLFLSFKPTPFICHLYFQIPYFLPR